MYADRTALIGLIMTNCSLLPVIPAGFVKDEVFASTRKAIDQSGFSWSEIHCFQHSLNAAYKEKKLVPELLAS